MKNLRVAMMTWHTYINYGSVLQASALYYVIKRMGHAPSLIHYYPKAGIIEQRKVKITDLLRAAKKKLANVGNAGYTSSEKNRLFEDFLDERTTKTKLCRSNAELSELNNEYDAFVCGSDQIWSPLGCNEKYYLSFVENPDKMIAYAPSFGVKKISNPVAEEIICRNLLRFKHLSVREQHGAEIISKLTGQTAKVVLDPTLLLDSGEWDQFADVKNTRGLDEKDYILCYFLGDSNRYRKYVRKIASEMQLPVYVIPITQKQKRCPEAVPFEVGPREFVSLIRNAKYVCTDSFHGVAFSVNYNIPFCAFPRFDKEDPRNQNSRIEHLLQLLDLKDCLIQYGNPGCKGMPVAIDFTEANIRLEEQRKLSLAYLEEALFQAVQAEKKAIALPYKITDTCCGCGACATVCSQNAIRITYNDAGFQHYEIDEQKCLKCGKCRTVCPMWHITAAEMEDSLGLYSARSTSKQVLEKSSSGGIAHELVGFFQQEGRPVCGCAYDSLNNCARHIIVMPGEKERASLLQGSKYIQSISAESIQMITDLAAESQVAFFGTPCQVAAVDKILRRKNLRGKAVLVELICHGVPSYHLWSSYLSSIRKQYHTGDHPSVMFRYSDADWHRRKMRMEGNGHYYQKDERKDDFYAFFRRRLCDMDSCYECPYREKSAADLRIGDYWGKRFAEEKLGMSMVIAITHAGMKVLHELNNRGCLNMQEQDLRDYWTVQQPYNTAKPLYHGQLIEVLRNEEQDIRMLRKTFCQYYDLHERTAKVKQMVKGILKRG